MVGTACHSYILFGAVDLRIRPWRKSLQEEVSSLFFSNDIAIFVADLQRYKKALVLYFVPAGLYCLYNNLAFVNLAEYDPATYFLLLQFRVVLTGLVFQVLFQKQLSRIQWLSMILLTFGCILKEIHRTHHTKESSSSLAFQVFDYHFILILVQVFASCFAGVYNEYLLKDCKAHFMLQNVFMYTDSIICNFAVLGLKGELLSAFTIDSVKAIGDPFVLAVIVNNTCIGICVSLFLRSMNSILKSFASAIELIFTAILSWAIFGIPIDIYTLVSILIITGAIILYSQNPVINQLSNTGLNETLLTRKENDVK
ncbi:UDP-galactose transporter senju [Patella vulgata]|uniref:UDP-galactose transporter senju n=1 Tax=Patella vulgata TaxID=6465 RepID=UPI0024A80DB8|nr:UDP-galactose transporter senju [Patella vulgata]